MDRYEREIVELHQFFVDWFKGDIPNDDATFARFAHNTLPEFVIVTPDGHRLTYNQIESGIYQAYGKRPTINITIKAVQHLHTYGDISIVAYEEWQVTAGQESARLSTVVFKDDDSAPNGLQWVYVQETWKAGHAPA